MISTATDTVNRALWTLLGLALAAGGTYGALASLGHIDGVHTNSPLLWPELIQDWRDAGATAPLSVAGAGLLAALLGFVLLRAQLPARRASIANLRVESPGELGATQVRGGALPGALAADLRRMPAVLGANVALSGPPEATKVRVRLDVVHGTTASRLSIQLQRCLDRFAETTGVKIAEIEVTLRLQEPLPPLRVT